MHLYFSISIDNQQFSHTGYCSMNISNKNKKTSLMSTLVSIELKHFEIPENVSMMSWLNFSLTSSVTEDGTCMRTSCRSSSRQESLMPGLWNPTSEPSMDALISRRLSNVWMDF